MGRFGSAKATSDNPTILQRMLNYLIDLLDKGYSVNTTINGKKIDININPEVGIQILSDGVLTFGVSSDGNTAVSRLYDPDDPDSYMELGRTGDFAAVKYFADGSEYLRIEVDTIFNLAEIKATGMDALLVSNGNQGINLRSDIKQTQMYHSDTIAYELILSDSGMQLYKDSVLIQTWA